MSMSQPRCIVDTLTIENNFYFLTNEDLLTNYYIWKCENRTLCGQKMFIRMLYRKGLTR